ncbi:MAG TPA: PilZ domain-containing protein [Pyrinomonadaceae bacterium]|nr:PilZ domain-containing protein [Pyrinomonadaceae bacterium]
MAGEQQKSKRLRERIKLALPVRVMCRESAGHEWIEMSRLTDVTPFGARFTISHPTEVGRLLQLTLAMPRQLRCFDHVEDQYRVWALVRHITPRQGGDALLRYDVGVAFAGKNPPASFIREPATRYEADAISAENNLWQLREVEEKEAAGAASRSKETRLHMAIPVSVEVFDAEGRVSASEQTVTENISRRGASVWTTLKVERGRFVRLTSTETGLSVLAAVRATRTGPDGIPRLHLEFMDRQWPLEGLE